MDCSNISFGQLLKLGFKLIAHRVQLYLLGTNECVQVKISTGSIKGRKRTNLYEKFGEYYAFEGIPYAKPPIGELRFRAPQPPEHWPNVLDCTGAGNKPLQKHVVLNFIEGSEDCLYLNVYTKKLIGEQDEQQQHRLPVMVWFYGGGFTIGEASRDIYGPDYFLSKDVVLVTFNYRLGPLGFLSLKDSDLQVPGNAAIKDQIAALRWVQTNISCFNGDPNNVTVFGESAGAASIHLLMLSPLAKRLFHKAILLSGTVMCPWVWAPDNNWALRLAQACGYKGSTEDESSILKFLMSTDAKVLIRQSTLLRNKEECRNYILFPFSPVVEPYNSENCVINKPYEELLSNAWGNTIPIIIGGTSFEGLYHYNETMQMPFLLEEICEAGTFILPKFREQHSEKQIKRMASKLLHCYFDDESQVNMANLMKYLDLMSYRSFWVGINEAIEARCQFATGTDTYCYRFDFDSEYFNHFRILNCGPEIRGVSHADDISYLFYNIMASKLSLECKEYEIISILVDLWYTFATTANPNKSTTLQSKGASLVWPTIDKASRTNSKGQLSVYDCLNIGNSLQVVPLPEYRKLMVWREAEIN